MGHSCLYHRRFRDDGRAVHPLAVPANRPGQRRAGDRHPVDSVDRGDEGRRDQYRRSRQALRLEGWGARRAQVRSAEQSSVAVGAAVARPLPSPIGARLLRAAQESYSQGMSEVMLVSAAMMIAGAILMALFLPARAPQESPQTSGVPATESREEVGERGVLVN